MDQNQQPTQTPVPSQPVNQPQQKQAQNPIQTPNQTPSPQQPTEKASFWKSKDPAIVIARIVLYIFVGIPLLGILFAILLAVLSAARR